MSVSVRSQPLYNTPHVESGDEPVTLSEPPARVTDQVKNCNPTPVEHVFTNNELVEIVNRANVLRENPLASASIPHFVSLHKVFLVACVLCLFHNEGYCATISSQRFLDDQQISLDDLKRTTLCNDCLRR